MSEEDVSNGQVCCRRVVRNDNYFEITVPLKHPKVFEFLAIDRGQCLFVPQHGTRRAGGTRIGTTSYHRFFFSVGYSCTRGDVDEGGGCDR